MFFEYRMAPKEQKRKPATKKTDKTEEQTMSEQRHNMITDIDLESKIAEFKEITQWLREYRINKAITHSTSVYMSLIKAFWDMAKVIEVDGKEIIQGQYWNFKMIQAEYAIPILCTRGCLLRMKCVNDILGGQINKAWLPMRYKFLIHVLIQCLSNRHAGYDMAGNDLVGLVVALVLNKLFSISKFIYVSMKENLKRTGARTTRNKFWMYPRFLHMIMNVQHSNHPKADNNILKIDAMLEHSLKIFRGVAVKSDSTESDDDDDDDDDDDGAGATAGNVPGGSGAGGDEEDSDSDDNSPEPGYEYFYDNRGVRQVRRIRQEEDVDYVPSDTEAERLKKKETAVRRKKKSRKYIGASSVQPTVSQHEPVHEAEIILDLGLTADEASAMLSSPPRTTEPPPMATSLAETPTVTPQAEPARTMASVIRATTSQYSSKRRSKKFSEMQQDEKVDFLFSQLQAAACQIDRQSKFMNITKSDVIKQQVEINTLKSTVERQQAEIAHLKAQNERLKAAADIRERQLLQMRAADNTRGVEMNRLKERSTEVQRAADALKAKHDDMREWYNTRNTTLTEGFKTIKDNVVLSTKRVNILWSERCKQLEILRKRDQDREDPGNPDMSALSQQPGASESTQIMVYKPQQIMSKQGTSGGTQEEMKQLESSYYVESSSDIALQGVHPVSGDIALQGVHPVSGEELEEGELVAEFSNEQILALREMKVVEDATIDQIPSEPEIADLDNLDEIVFEGDDSKSTYVREDGTELNPFDEV
ncbi:hypothetical protein HanPI659440_Chr04g0168531 [Helianthus annuus]|nr:hypothetical protein HanPI659440_Chr04g0168531 [Helianthus annuus]